MSETENPEDSGERGEQGEPSEPNELQEAMQKAGQAHQRMSNTKSWALSTARDIERQAHEGYLNDELEEQEYEMMIEQANYVRSVYRRVEHGDSNVAQVNGEF